MPSEDFEDTAIRDYDRVVEELEEANDLLDFIEQELESARTNDKLLTEVKRRRSEW